MPVQQEELFILVVTVRKEGTDCLQFRQYAGVLRSVLMLLHRIMCIDTDFNVLQPVTFGAVSVPKKVGLSTTGNYYQR